MSKDPDPGSMTSVKKRYQKRWYSQEPGLRERYHHDKSAFLRDFPRDETVSLALLELGMKAFARMTKQVDGRMASYWRGGELAMGELVSILTSDCLDLTGASDFIFVSIDFESSPQRYRGIRGFGASKLDTRKLLGVSGRPAISTSNFRLRSCDSPCIFGPTKCISECDLPGVTRETITNHQIDDCDSTSSTSSGLSDSDVRKVILVGHGIRSDLRILDHYSVSLESMPNIHGVIDTGYLALKLLKYGPSLRRLLEAMDVPFDPSTFHCGGNDAHYTLQALLALVCAQSQAEGATDLLSDRMKRLDELAKQEIPVSQQDRERREGLDEIWDCGLFNLIEVAG